ncbi:MAG: CHAP domain-containing protein, partial [Ruminococcaceae bacterium]|nr:CHAP domain-containing protein [Oscillospiraceae bacterium]
MKKFIRKSIALLLVVMFVLSCATFTLSAATYVTGSNPVSDSYKSGKYYHQLSQIPMTSNQRTNVVAVAMSQLGYQESDADGDFSGLNGGTSNFTEYNYNFGNVGGYGYYWCASFATWVFRQAGMNTVGTGLSNSARNHMDDAKYMWCEIGCHKWLTHLNQYGYFHASASRGGSYVPKSADLIFYSSDGSESGHVGIVVYSDGTNVYTVEGNTSSGSGLDANGGGVYYKSYPLSSSYIYGYGAMPYNTNASDIDYSGANPTPGVYVAANSNKYLYKNADLTGDYVVMPKYSMFTVTEIVNNNAFKCIYNGQTYYITNHATDRIVQLTKTSGSISGNTNMGINASMFIDAVNDISVGNAIAGSTIGGTPSVLMPIAQPTSTTMTISGWAIVSNGQPANSMHYSFDYGASWEQCSGGVYAAFSDAEMDNFNAIAASHSITNLSATNARFGGVQINLAGKEGQTVNVTLGVKGNDGGIYPCVTIAGIQVPGGSGSGGGGSVATNDKAMAAVINNINGVGPDGTANTNYSTELISTHNGIASTTLPKALTEPFIYITGWCMTNEGQTSEIKFSGDGGKTWAGTCTVSSWQDGTDDHVAAAQAMAGMPDPDPTKATFLSACANLSAFAGWSGDVTFGRTSSWGETIPFVTIKGVTVPGSQSGSGSTGTIPAPSTVYTGTPAYGLRYVASIDFINGIGRDGNAASTNNAWGTLGYANFDYSGLDRVTPGMVNSPSLIKVQSNNSIYIKGWAAVAGGVKAYVYSVGDSNEWYLCSGTLSNPTGTDNDNIQAFATAAPYSVNSYSPTNARYNNLTADLSHWEGQTVDVKFGAVANFGEYAATMQPCHFLTIQNVSVPAHVCQSVNEATCTDPKICDTCGATMAYALGHKPGAEATCTTDQKCLNCGIVLISHTGHNPGEAATCTTPQKCTKCGEVLAAATNHSAGAAATCTTAQTCTKCGEVLTAALGHNPGPAATCTTAQTCTRCSYVYEPVKGHTPGAEATCTTDQICTVCKTVLEGKKGHTAAPQVSCTDISYCTTCGEKIRDAKGHTEVVLPATEPTCTEGGYSAGIKCSECGVIIEKQTPIAAKGHTNGPAATCTTDQICTVCQAVVKEALGHTPGAAASCTAPQICIVCEIELAPQKAHTPGATATCTDDQICTVCRTVLVQATGHEEKVTLGTPATCTTSGVSDLIVCTVCDKVIQSQEVIDALGHLAGPAATCTEDQICTREGCGYVFVKASGHNEVNIQAKDPTCTEAGNGVGKRCTICQQITEEPDIIPKLGHIEGDAATCTTPQICERCLEIIIPALGHKAETIPAVTPTCTGTGLSEGQKCSVCDIVTIPQAMIPAKGHTYDDEEDAECNVCGHVREVGCPHEYSNACDVDCNLCGEIRVAAEHKEQILAGKDATCTASGLTEGSWCMVCFKTIVPQTVIKALKHNYKASTVAATCTTRGYTSYECQNDGCTSAYKSNYIAASGHDYTEKVFSATCIAG